MEVTDHVHEDFFRRFKTERMRIADVQLHDPVALVFEALGLDQYGTTNVVEDVRQLLRLVQLVGVTRIHVLEVIRSGLFDPFLFMYSGTKRATNH